MYLGKDNKMFNAIEKNTQNELNPQHCYEKLGTASSGVLSAKLTTVDSRTGRFLPEVVQTFASGIARQWICHVHPCPCNRL